MKTKIKVIVRLAGVAGLLLLATGCAFMNHRHHAQGTSVMQFLYPRDPEHIDTTTVPVLQLPLRVGIAFVPSGDARGHGYGYGGGGELPESAKAELLKRVAAEFRGLPYVKSIEVIPTAYLRPAGGFANVDQLKAMFGLDVVTLVAYDQVQFTDEGFLSLAYWTIVGAYVVQGERNDTQTLMEAVVYDIPSRQLLFRAPGNSRVKASATLVNVTEQLRKDSARGFDEATAQMIVNLKAELSSFQERVKQAPQDYKIVHRPGYTGGGAIDGVLAGGLAAAAMTGLWNRRRRGRAQ
jgi:rhombotail lipoprotein